ncbi:MAG TPA: transcription termination factor NusA [Anaerolineae bacterium]|nr:transcription termination factor NusA [Anaerolineae bacterium]
MKSDFAIALSQICADRKLLESVILEAIETALVSAYKRDFGATQSISVTLDPRTGRARVFAEKEIVEQVEDPRTQVALADARKLDAMAEVGGTMQIETTPHDFGRIAAQTAKQVILQRIREAERDALTAEFAEREDEMVNGTVRNIDSRTGNITLSLGRAEGLLPHSEQIPGETFALRARLRAYVVKVEKGSRGPEITVSRAHRNFLKRLLELEVPELTNGTVEIKAIAREAGQRSKVAVAVTQAGVDPVGSCVGMRGQRIQNVVNELNGEKIDVVEWSADIATFIANSLSPAKASYVRLNHEEKTAIVVVPDRQLSLAIGKEGQNARLAAKLTGWRIDIKSETAAAEEATKRAEEEAAAAARAAERAAKAAAAQALLAEAEAALAAEEQAEAEPAAAEPVAAAAQAPAAAVVAEAPEAEALAEPLQAAPAAEAPAEPAVEPESAPEAAAEPEATAPAAAAPEAAAPVVEAEPAAEWVDEIEEEDGEPGVGQKKAAKKKAKQRRRVLEYDENLDTVVARRKRKPSRERHSIFDYHDLDE